MGRYPRCNANRLIVYQMDNIATLVISYHPVILHVAKCKTILHISLYKAIDYDNFSWIFWSKSRCSSNPLY